MKHEILETSLKQFLKYGVREMSIQKLIAPLGISTKTVYKYFENKEKLLEEALILYYLKRYDLMKIRLLDQDVVSLLFDAWYMGIEAECKVNKLFFHDLHYYYPELEKKVEATIVKKTWKEFIQLIEKGIKEGVFREDISPEIILEAMSVVYTSIARKEEFKKFRTTTNIIFLNSIAVLIRGICTRKGVQQLDNYIMTLKTSEKVKASTIIGAANNHN